jgi:hypothetical protein
MSPGQDTILPDDPLAAMLAPIERGTDQQRHRGAAAAAVLLRSLDAQEPIEAVLATQAVLAHRTAMQCLRSVAQQHDLPAALASRLLGRAATLSNAMLSTVRAIDRRQARAASRSLRKKRA